MIELQNKQIMKCIICCKEKNIDIAKVAEKLKHLDNIDFVDENGYDFFIRTYYTAKSGTTLATQYSDSKAKCCGDCYKKIKRAEKLELLLFSVGAITMIYLLLIFSDGGEGISSGHLFLLPISLFLMIIPAFLAKRRVKIHPDSPINDYKDIPGIELGEFKFSNSKVLLRTRDNEYWWLM